MEADRALLQVSPPTARRDGAQGHADFSRSQRLAARRPIEIDRWRRVKRRSTPRRGGVKNRQGDRGLIGVWMGSVTGRPPSGSCMKRSGWFSCPRSARRTKRGPMSRQGESDAVHGAAAACARARAEQGRVPRHGRAVRRRRAPHARRHLALGRAHPEGEWGELARRLDLARAEFDARAVKKLARSRDDRTLQWLLERRDPKRFHLALEGADRAERRRRARGSRGAVAEVLSDAEQRAKVLDAVAKRLAARRRRRGGCCRRRRKRRRGVTPRATPGRSRSSARTSDHAEGRRAPELCAEHVEPLAAASASRPHWTRHHAQGAAAGRLDVRARAGPLRAAPRSPASTCSRSRTMTTRRARSTRCGRP